MFDKILKLSEKENATITIYTHGEFTSGKVVRINGGYTADIKVSEGQFVTIDISKISKISHPFGATY